MPELRRSARVASNPTSSQASETQTEPISEPSTKKLQTSSVKELQVGDKMPDIKLLDEDENEVDLLKETQANRYVIIFAYPKASTPGCTRQVCGFQKSIGFLQKSNAKVYGLSADKSSAQKNFVTKQKLEYPLLSDPSRELVEVLGAKKEPTGIKRSHWIFVDGILKVKKIAISPEESFNSAKEDIEAFSGGPNDQDESKETNEPKEESNLVAPAPADEVQGDPKEAQQPKEESNSVTAVPGDGANIQE